jgi:regulator of sigma E protease
MTILKIALGLFGLGIVVFVHELGHFLGARLAGIDVEAFSIGWGNPILKKKFRGVEYRLGMFPLGGYCKMAGHSDLGEAWDDNKANGVKPAKGTFYGASPFGRIITCFGGPLFNLIFAILILSFIWGIGFEDQTLGNKIILLSELDTDNIYPADEAGLRTGDRIIEINGRKTSYYHEIQENIAVNPDRLLPVTVERQGETTTLFVKPALDKSTGMGRIGVYFWTDTIVDNIVPGSDAAIAGLLPGDRIIGVNDIAVTNTIEFFRALEAGSSTARINYVRTEAGSTEYHGTANIVLSQDGRMGLGIIWPMVQYRTPSLSPPAALAKGAAEGWKTLVISARSLSLLFKGIDLTKAVSGPVRIT